ncbi:MAG: hypothetical protein FWD47_13340 [Treponema sp.]|nr:hypothetical protein [Treponema sp.]
MAKSNNPMGFFEGLLRDIEAIGIINATRGSDGKPDPYAASGAMYGLRGDMSLNEHLEFGALLGAMGAFDKKNYSTRDIDYSRTHVVEEHNKTDEEWQEFAEDNNYGIDPYDYEDEYDYLSDVKKAEIRYKEGAEKIFSAIQSNINEIDRYLESITNEERDFIDEYEEKQEKLHIMKTALYTKYSDDYPQLFGKKYMESDIDSIARTAARKKQTAHLPVEMFLYLVNTFPPITGLGLFEMLDVFGHKRVEESIREKTNEIYNLIASEKWENEDCYHIISIVREKYFYDVNSFNAGIDILNQLISTGIDDESFSYIIEVVVDDLLDFIGSNDSSESALESEGHIVDLCKYLKIPKTHKTIYETVIKRFKFFKDAIEIILVLRPDGQNLLENRDTTYDFMDDHISAVIHGNDPQSIFSKLEILCEINTYSKEQQKWINRGIISFIEFINDLYLQDETYEWVQKDTKLKQRILDFKYESATLFGRITGEAFIRVDDILFNKLFITCSKSYSTSKKILNQYLNALINELNFYTIYYDSHDDWLAKCFSMYDVVVSQVNVKASKDMIDRLNDFKVLLDNEEARRNRTQAVPSITIPKTPIRYIESNTKKEEKAALKKLEKIYDDICSGKTWKTFDKNCPAILSFEFLYPNGMHGDIDMYLSTEYGEAKKINELKYLAKIPVEHHEKIVLMGINHGASSRMTSEEFKKLNVDKRMVEDFLHKYNYYYLAQLLIRNAIDSGVSHRNPILKKVYNIRVEYSGTIRERRRKIYAELQAANLTTTKWVSEQQAYAIIKSIYPDAEYQYKSEWLGNQSLDIIIPSLSIGIEYQGAQHFHPVSLFGGEDGLSKRLELDDIKRNLCRKNGIYLLEWRYDEPLTKEFIQQKINGVKDECGIISF